MTVDQLVFWRDRTTRLLVGQFGVVGSSGPGGNGSVVFTEGWDSVTNRMRRRALVTGTGIFNFQSFEGTVPDYFFAGQYPPFAVSADSFKVRIQDEVGFESHPGGNGSVVFTEGWDSVTNRMRRRALVTGTGIFNFQSFEGTVPDYFFAGQYPPFAVSADSFKVRIQDEVGFEYVSGVGVVNAAWGIMINFSNLLLGAPAGTLNDGHIGFQWFQTGNNPTNIRAVAAADDGTNLFDADTGIAAVVGTIPTMHHLRVDFNFVAGTIEYYIDQMLVATFTVGSGVLGGTSVSNYRYGVGVNAANGSACAGHYAVLGEPGGFWHNIMPTVS